MSLFKEFDDKKLNEMIKIYDKTSQNDDDRLKIIEFKRKLHEEQLAIDKENQKFNKLLEKINKSYDQFDSLHTFLIRSIYKYDLTAIDNVKQIMEEISDKFFRKYNQDISLNICDDKDLLCIHYLEYISEKLEICLNMLDGYHSTTVKLKFWKYQK